MLVYSIIMFAVAALFLGLGVAVYQGNTKLIHDYHQTKVKETERKAYGKAFAKGMFAICATLFISGLIALMDILGVSLIALLAGLIVSIVILAKVQRTYNGGLF